MAKTNEQKERSILTALVDNESGALGRIVGLFSGRGYNIESLTVAEVDEKKSLSRVTIVTAGSSSVIAQIEQQLLKLVPVHSVENLSATDHVERELMLIKVKGTGDARVEALRIAEIFRASVVDSTTKSFVFELTGKAEKLDAFSDLMQPLGAVETCRTGVTAIARGERTLK